MAIVRSSPKTCQLQIRLSAPQKAAIQRAAANAGLDMSAYVLGRVLSLPAEQFRDRVANCMNSDTPKHALAELNSLLSALTASELRDAVAAAPPASPRPYLSNYVAALVETACARRKIAAPSWTLAIAPLAEPVFGTELVSLRFHLLTHSPAAFRHRNIFIDATIGDRV